MSHVKRLSKIMRKRKKTKSIDDVSVMKLLDDFVDLDVEDDSKRKDMDDDEYIRMMVEKEEQRKFERARRTAPSETHIDEQNSPERTIEKEKAPMKVKESMEEVFPETCEHDLSPEDETDIDEIMKTQERIDEPVLTGRMKASVEFLQGEVETNESKRAARKTLEKYRKDIPVEKKKEIAPVKSEKLAPIKRCQSCYFCVGEKKVSGSCWCHCTNPGRSTHAVAKGSWVKSRMNLPCWKAPEE
jgi:hypothetical protein